MIASVGDTIDPAILAFFGLQEDNSYLSIAFSEAIWGNVDANVAIDENDLIIYGFSAGGATAVSISDVLTLTGTELSGGEDSVRVVLGITGTPDGTETFTIRPANGSSIFDGGGNPMSGTSTTGTITLNDETEPPPGGDFAWANLANVDTSNLSVSKSGGADGYNIARCNSTVPLASGQYLEFSINDEWTVIVIGLDVSTSTTAYTDLDYAFIMNNPFEIYAYYNNTSQAQAAEMDAATDRFRVERSGSYIRLHQRIGAGEWLQVYQYTQEASDPLYIHIDIYGMGQGISNVSFVTQ